MTANRDMFGQPRKRPIARISNVVIALGLVLAALMVVMWRDHQIRTLSESVVASRKRGRFVTRPLMFESVAPTASGPVAVEELWVERRHVPRFLVLSRPSGTLALIARVRSPDPSVGIRLRGVGTRVDTFELGTSYYGSEGLRVAIRGEPFPDTLEPIRARRR